MVMRADGSEPRELAEAKEPFHLSFHPDGKAVIFTDVKSIKMVTIADRTVRTLLTGAVIREPDMTLDGRLSASVRGLQDEVRSYDLNSGENWTLARGCSASLSPDGKCVTQNAGDHRSVRLRDWRTGKEVGKISAPRGLIFDNQFWSNHPDWIASKSQGGHEDIYLHSVPLDKAWRVTASGSCDRPDLFVTGIGKLFGISLENDDFFAKIWELITRLDETNLLTLAFGLVTILTLVMLKRFAPKAPAPLVVVIGAIVSSSIFQLAELGVSVVGQIPSGLPMLQIPLVSLADLRALLPAALAISVLIFSDEVLIAREFARKNRYDIDTNQELVALGAMNVSSGLFQSFATAASSSRTVVNDNSGGKSQMVGLILARLVIISRACPRPGCVRPGPPSALFSLTIPQQQARQTRQHAEKQPRVDFRDHQIVAPHAEMRNASTGYLTRVGTLMTRTPCQ